MEELQYRFLDHQSKEGKEMWWDKEMKCVEHSYKIPTYNIPEMITHHSNGTTYEPKWLRANQKPKNCVDIGANVGCFSHYASPHFENVFAFEAVKDTYDLASENLKNLLNVQIYNLAAYGESNQEIPIFYDENGLSGDSSIYGEENGGKGEMTKTVSLDHVFGLCNIDMIDYLKVDCEGAEYDFLMSKDLSRINFMVVEFHPGTLGPQKMTDLVVYIKKFFNLQFMVGQWIGFYERKG